MSTIENWQTKAYRGYASRLGTKEQPESQFIIIAATKEKVLEITKKIFPETVATEDRILKAILVSGDSL